MISVLFVQCTKGNDDLLSLPLTPYTSNQLRIDGYYYQIGYDGKTINSAYFFYGNGVLISTGGAKTSLMEMDSYIQKYYLHNQSYKKVKYDWGVFMIEKSVIKFERWYPSEKPHKAFVREGIILNDTTFKITKSYYSNSSQHWTENETYHFRKFSPKPDSINTFIP